MFDLRDYQKSEPMLADHLPWFALVTPTTLLNKDGSYSTVLRYRGPDIDSATEHALLGLRRQLNNVVTRLGDRWCLHFEARRTPTDAYPAGSFDRPAAALIDQERARRFAGGGQAFETRTYLTLTYLPPEDRSSRLADLFVELPPDEIRPNPQRAYWEQYHATVEKLAALLDGFCPEVDLLADDELVTFLHGAVSPRPHGVAVPASGGEGLPPMFLAERLCDAPLEAGLGLKLGDQYVVSLGVRGWPHATFPGVLGRLCGLPLSLRWTVRWLPMDRLAAEKQLNTLKRHWFQKRKNLWTMMREVATKEESRLESSRTRRTRPTRSRRRWPCSVPTRRRSGTSPCRSTSPPRRRRRRWPRPGSCRRSRTAWAGRRRSSGRTPCRAGSAACRATPTPTSAGP